MRHLVLTLVTATLAAAATPATADVCTAKKLKAVAKLESALLNCQAKVASTGDSDGLTDCRTKALDKFTIAYDKAGTCGGDEMSCLSSSADCETEVTDAVTGTLPSKCIAAKRKAAGKLAAGTLSCHSKGAKKDVALDSACVDKAVAKFQSSMTKADEDGACSDGGDLATLVDDACVSPAVAVDAGMVTEGCPATCESVDDFDYCTDDTCESGTAVHTPVDIDDGDACTTDSCTSGGTNQGIYHTPVSTNDGNACTTDSCDPDTGVVSHTPVNIDDGDACTTDDCSPGTGDISHTPVATDDGNVCTVDSCDSGTGVVSHDPVNVDDGDACTVDSCDASGGSGGGISHEPVDINDGDACTVDSCDSVTGVSHTPVSVDDGDACTVDSCSPGTGGVYHDPVPVDDGNPCTEDSCDPIAGVTHTYTGDDGVCPAGQVCSPSGCVD